MAGSFKSLFLATLIALGALSLEVCADDITYKDEKEGFSITYPSTLSAMRNQQGAALIIFFPSKRFSLSQDYISVTVTSSPPSSMTLEKMIDIYYKYDRTVLERKNLTINNMEFISIVQTHQQKILFKKLNLKLYHLITVKGNRIYTITYAASADTYENNLAQAKDIMQSFKLEGGN